MDCGNVEQRDRYQQRLLMRNEAWLTNVQATEGSTRPDGDVDLPSDVIHAFSPCRCLVCGGEMRPDVVFHGGSIARSITSTADAWVDQCDAVLVLGTSLTTYSSMRLVRAAAQAKKPVTIVCRGPTRADEFASFRSEHDCGALLDALLSDQFSDWNSSASGAPTMDPSPMISRKFNVPPCVSEAGTVDRW